MGGLGIELRKIAIGTPTLSSKRKAAWPGTLARVPGWSRVVVDPTHVQKLHAREPGDLGGAWREPRGRPVGEGDSRTSHVHISEESDSGAVLMNHLNKDGNSLAEGEEGSPLVKENTHQSSTHSTRSEVR